jgi:DNA-directed RNA polymerase specialized sigma24 family protein
MPHDPSHSAPTDDAFPSTQWSLVARAAGTDGAAREAFAGLCAQYWYPVYAYFRRRTGSVDRAEDLTQGLFAHLLDGEGVAAADRRQGRFRGFLIGCCRNYLVDRHRRSTAAKRGGAARRVPLDFAAAAERFGREPADGGDAEKRFLRSWALTLLDGTAAAVRAEYDRVGRAALFDRLRTSLAGDPEAEKYRSIGDEFGLTENAIKKAAQQLRQRFAVELRRRILETVEHPGQVEEEIRELFAAVGG